MCRIAAPSARHQRRVPLEMAFGNPNSAESPASGPRAVTAGGCVYPYARRVSVLIVKYYLILYFLDYSCPTTGRI